MKISKPVKKEYDDDGLLPLVNIIFLLLIFFMIVGVIEQKVSMDNLNMPAADFERYDNNEIKKIFIDENNIIYVDDKIIEIKKLDDYLTENKVKEVALIADKSLMIKNINSVLSILIKNDIKEIKLLTNKNEYR